MDRTDDQTGSPLWSNLPTPAVEKIYSYLDRTDQKSMSLVCRNWCAEYSSPSLWRKVTFCFPDLESKTELCPDVVLAWRYGRMFRHVEIVFSHSSDGLWLSSDTVVRQLNFILEAVTSQSQLLSISFESLLFCLIRPEDARRSSKVHEKIVNLFKLQTKLKCIKFKNTEFFKADAEKVLNVALANNSKTLRYLHLRGFVQESPDDDFENNTVDNDWIFVVLMNLEILQIDYTRMFENIVLSFYEYRNKVDMRKRKGCFKIIKLLCHCFSHVNYLGIPPIVWDFFGSIFPSLRIEMMIITPSCDLIRFSKYIVSRMPIRELVFKSFGRYVQAMEIGSLLRHITSCNINETIEKLVIYWIGSSSSISKDLISFTRTSPLLKILTLDLQHPVAALDTVFSCWLEHRPVTLKFVKITIVLVPTAEDKEIYARLSDCYTPLLQSLGLSLSLAVEMTFVPLVVD